MEPRGMVYLFIVLCLAVPILGFNLYLEDDWDHPDCKGRKQSPIDLDSTKATPLKENKIELENYDSSLTGNIFNNGHTISVEITAAKDNKMPVMRGGGLNTSYEAMFYHFHWGMRYSNLGAEHYIDNKTYILEMHIIHKDVEIPTFDKALAQQSGVAVVGILFEMGTEEETTKGLQNLCALLPFLREFKAGGPYPGEITLESILGTSSFDQFFLYEGSLTTPPCTETILWVVSTKIMKVPIDCLEYFWDTRDMHHFPIVNNYRALQPLNGRTVHYRK